ncbi:MAG: hypothetical protein WC919_02640 [Candidatus Paceibacterota bacterium]|jgi:hypothetical protein
MRKPGQKMSDSDRFKLSMKAILNNILRFIRDDHGGKDAFKAQKKKILELAKAKGLDIEDDIIDFCVGSALEARKETRNGIAKRIKPSINELMRRICGH